MHEAQMDQPRLEMRWLPVTDELGQTRLQAVWIDAASLQSAPHHAA